MKTLRVEGWRFIPHSYAIVNQWQLLSLLKRKDTTIGIRDLHYVNNNWSPARGIFSPEQERELSSIPKDDFGDSVDAIYRISFPFDFSVPDKTRTVVFSTSEFKRFEHNYFKPAPDIKSLAASELFSVVTPSRWSREALLQLGLRENQIVVVPHGVDPDCFSRPSEEARSVLRANHRISGFVFCNTSAMSPNKGIGLLLRAFAVVAEKRPDVRLHLKGTDRIYQSKSFLGQAIESLPSRFRSVVTERLIYLGETISNKQMAEFYQLADAYVSPYYAEAFNLPALEASACGTPAICTRGGPTDEFMKESFTLFVDSKLTPTVGASNEALAPDLDHLIHLMFKAMDDEKWRKQASMAAAHHAAVHFNWDSIVDNLLGVIFATVR